MKYINCLRNKFSVIVMFTLFFLVNKSLFSQLFDSDIQIILERLPLEKKEELKDFDQKIKSYVDEYDWTGEVFENPLQISIQIFLQHKIVNFEDRYKGRFIISNNSDAQYYDKYWVFPYNSGDPLIHNESMFDPLESFIDFYIYILLGEEYDKYGKYLGNKYFERARNIANSAQFNSQYAWGWKERNELIDKLLSKEFKPYRNMKDQFFLGLSYAGEEDTTAQKYCEKAFTFIYCTLTQDPDNERVLQFLQAHNLQFINILGHDKDLLKRMSTIDPNNKALYKKHINE
ncbi:MAG: DUF4835 family protein [bacterium]